MSSTSIMSSSLSINNEIAEYQKKIEELKQAKVNLNFARCFGLDKDVVDGLENFSVEASYEWVDHANDEYGHSAIAVLHVKWGANGNEEFVRVDYSEEQGCGTESRYSPTVYCNIKGTTAAKKLVLNAENIDIKEKEEEWDDDDYKELRDTIERMVNE